MQLHAVNVVGGVLSRVCTSVPGGRRARKEKTAPQNPKGASDEREEGSHRVTSSCGVTERQGLRKLHAYLISGPSVLPAAQC